MSRDRLERLIKDGYQPAVILESSPGSYQAIINVPKLGKAHDREIAIRLTRMLNATYGNPALSGGVHPHRAPGYENRNPQQRREDGSYPEVLLIHAARQECARALALSRQIEAECQREAARKAREPVQMADPGFEPGTPIGDGIAAYQRHYRDILKTLAGGPVDLSRVDSMIAVRMRLTGHSQAAIEDAIRECAPRIREKDEGRDWNDYAKRTARFAYSLEGGRQTAGLSKYRRQWQTLEGREPQLPQVQAGPQRPPDPPKPSPNTAQMIHRYRSSSMNL